MTGTELIANVNELATKIFIVAFFVAIPLAIFKVWWGSPAESVARAEQRLAMLDAKKRLHEAAEARWNDEQRARQRGDHTKGCWT